MKNTLLVKICNQKLWTTKKKSCFYPSQKFSSFLKISDQVEKKSLRLTIDKFVQWQETQSDDGLVLGFYQIGSWKKFDFFKEVQFSRPVKWTCIKLWQLWSLIKHVSFTSYVGFFNQGRRLKMDNKKWWISGPDWQSGFWSPGSNCCANFWSRGWTDGSKRLHHHNPRIDVYAKRGREGAIGLFHSEENQSPRYHQKINLSILTRQQKKMKIPTNFQINLYTIRC